MWIMWVMWGEGVKRYSTTYNCVPLNESLEAPFPAHRPGPPTHRH